ncbi:MAG: hypothetical protein OEM96_01865 [Gemmatimonadota bacterium]|nr:hypothetical protein [Gemmatimonadota bacterium]
MTFGTCHRDVRAVERVLRTRVVEVSDPERSLAVTVVAAAVRELIAMGLRGGMAAVARGAIDFELAGSERLRVARAARCRDVGPDQPERCFCIVA